jgi:hypothetical protein
MTVKLGDNELRWWHPLVGVPLLVLFVGGFLAFFAGGGALLTFSGVKEIAGAYDDPNVGARCSGARHSRCVTVVRGVAQKGDGYVDVVAVTEAKREPVKLISDALPEQGTQIELEYRRGELVSLYDPTSGRRYHTEQWPRHGRDLGYGIFKLLGGLLLLVICPGLVMFALVRERLRARRSSAAA